MKLSKSLRGKVKPLEISCSVVSWNANKRAEEEAGNTVHALVRRFGKRNIFLLQEVDHWKNGDEYEFEDKQLLIHSAKSKVGIVIAGAEEQQRFDGNVVEIGNSVGIAIDSRGFVSSYLPDGSKSWVYYAQACKDAHDVDRKSVV